MKIRLLKLVVAWGALLASGCASALHESTPVTGARLQVYQPRRTASTEDIAHPQSVPSDPLPALVFAQGDNAESPSEVITAPDGTLQVKMGTVRNNQITIPPAPDYTKYWLLGVSIAAIGGGIYLMSSGWPSIGLRVLIAGIVGVVLSLTMDKYGWVYVLAVLAAGGYIAWEKYHAYKTGTAQNNPAKPFAV